MRSTLKYASFTLMLVLAVVSCKKINSDADGGDTLPIDTFSLKKPPKANAGLDQVITLLAAVYR